MARQQPSDYSAFLHKLPLELRWMVYKHLLVPSTEILTKPKLKKRAPVIRVLPDGITGIDVDDKTRHIHPQILSTCKQIFEEAEPILYGHTAFSLHECGSAVWRSLAMGGIPNELRLCTVNFIKILYIDVNRSVFDSSLTTLLEHFPCLRTVQAVTTWPTMCLKTFLNGTRKPNNLEVFQELSQLPQIKHLTCSFHLDPEIMWNFVYDGDFDDILESWCSDAFDAHQAAVYSGNELVYSFTFHRYWMKQIQQEMSKRDVLNGVPLAWRFGTEVTIERGPTPFVELTVNVVQSHIPCEAMGHWGEMSRLEEL
ncbi:hypothetical protein BT63DRAFT_457196 [Microthyrium microscopicum]|uniref:DUF7730 domain-containing protein n=1 Tax=Microthyrium microscopicum TaxID=703497 RepID=A0A6A6U6L3_9PEZI|nr:hypothetical protein BT63DRAFT_457196 [Microthyrium microscopicum]